MRRTWEETWGGWQGDSSGDSTRLDGLKRRRGTSAARLSALTIYRETQRTKKAVLFGINHFHPVVVAQLVFWAEVLWKEEQVAFCDLRLIDVDLRLLALHLRSICVRQLSWKNERLFSFYVCLKKKI